MSTPEEKLAKVRGSAPEKRPTVRVLSAATAHGDCRFAMLALATRADLDKLCKGTYFEVAFGQDPQAFQRGQMFERRVKEPAYGALIQLLREKADFPPTSVRIEDLRSRTPPNTEGLRQRAAETRQLLKQIGRNAAGAPHLIDGAVLTCTIAGQMAYYEADSLAAAAGSRLHGRGEVVPDHRRTVRQGKARCCLRPSSVVRPALPQRTYRRGRAA
jgi:hypothetical protein